MAFERENSTDVGDTGAQSSDCADYLLVEI